MVFLFETIFFLRKICIYFLENNRDFFSKNPVIFVRKKSNPGLQEACEGREVRAGADRSHVVEADVPGAGGSGVAQTALCARLQQSATQRGGHREAEEGVGSGGGRMGGVVGGGGGDIQWGRRDSNTRPEARRFESRVLERNTCFSSHNNYRNIDTCEDCDRHIMFDSPCVDLTWQCSWLCTPQPPDPQTRRPADPQTNRPADPQTLRPSDPQTHRPTDPQTCRPADPQTHRPGVKTAGNRFLDIRLTDVQLPYSLVE